MNPADLVGETVEMEGMEWVVTATGTRDGKEIVYLRELGEEGICVPIDELLAENPALTEKE